ncbi:Exopolyphosphatase [hydrothermal vent metagenome]|uniref:Exopolyphosphatase n=1 Tax=hydrothermal vent metagenome TaxID=652676 RepID=A0A3B1CG80_9ZZZZ
MKIASIDIGSNTVLLLIAEVDIENQKLVPLLNRYRMPRISKGLNVSNIISEPAVASLHIVLKKYKDIIDEYNCTKVLVNATQALRVAKNSEQIIDSIKRDLEFYVNVISGDQEAYLSFLGAQSGGFNTGNSALVIDIGGASTEIIHGHGNNISFKKSFPIGVVTLTEKYLLFEISDKTLSDAENYIINVLNELSNLNVNDSSVIAVAGTPTTLACAMQNLTEYSDVKVEGYKLSNDDLFDFIEIFKSLSSKDILENFGKIMEGREDIILAGTLILNNILKLLKKDFLYASGRGLRYGAIIEFMNSIKDKV